MVLQHPRNGVPMKSAEKKRLEFRWVRWVSGHLFDFDIKEVQALLTDRKPPTNWRKWGSLLQKRWSWSENGLSKNPMVDHHVPHWICYGSLGIWISGYTRSIEKTSPFCGTMFNWNLCQKSVISRSPTTNYGHFWSPMVRKKTYL